MNAIDCILYAMLGLELVAATRLIYRNHRDYRQQDRELEAALRAFGHLGAPGSEVSEENRYPVNNYI
jgi:hypothetical protein